MGEYNPETGFDGPTKREMKRIGRIRNWWLFATVVCIVISCAAGLVAVIFDPSTFSPTIWWLGLAACVVPYFGVLLCLRKGMPYGKQYCDLYEQSLNEDLDMFRSMFTVILSRKITGQIPTRH